MKKILKVLKYTGITVVILLGIILATAYISSAIRMGKKFPVAAQNVAVPETPEAIAEGKRLYVSRGCIDCHGENLAGKTFIDDPAIGRGTGANLTLARSDAAAVARSIRHGVRSDGSALLLMPATDFQGMSDEEVGNIIAYIRSVPKNETPTPPNRVGPLSRILLMLNKIPLLIPAEQIDHTKKQPEKVSARVSVEYGKYLAEGCTGCHGSALTGGPIPGAPPEWAPAQNITGAGRLGSWSEKEFITTVRSGVRPDGTNMKFPMPWQNLKLMTDTELKALFLYLKTLPVKG